MHQLKGFNQPDTSNNIAQLIDYLSQYESLPQVTTYKQRSYELLDLKIGSRVLDIGCGLGYDLMNLMPLIGASGHAFGVDVSEQFLVHARNRTRQQNITLIRHDMQDMGLPLPPASVDACRADRVLIHMTNPIHVVRKMSALTRGGGSVVIVEPDWGVFRFESAHPTIASRVTHAFASCRNSTVINPRVGAELASIMGQTNLLNIDVQAMEVVVTSIAESNKIIPIHLLLEHAVNSGQIDANESDALLADLVDRDACNRFFACHTILIAKGTTPA